MQSIEQLSTSKEVTNRGDSRLQENKILGDYKLLKNIGNGPLGAVWAAEHRFTKKNVALKLLPDELSSDRSFLMRFEELVAFLSTLDHPNLVKVHNVSFGQGYYFLATDCVVDEHQQTVNLGQYVLGRGGKLSEQELFSIASQLASVLDYVHSLPTKQKQATKQPLAHLNLKPNNILINGKTAQGEPLIKVADWGLSRVIGLGQLLFKSYKGVCESFGFTNASGSFTDRFSPGFTMAPRLMLLLDSLRQNLAFLAPEQKVPGGQDALDTVACDSWSFGVLIYWLLSSGKYPEGYIQPDLFKSATGICNWAELLKNTLQYEPVHRAVHLMPLLQKQAPMEQKSDPQAPGVILKPEKEPLKEVAKESLLKEGASTSEGVLSKEHQHKESHLLVSEYIPEKTMNRAIEPLPTESVAIQQGYYFRGSVTGCRDESPRHEVKVDAFKMDIHPVTNEQFVRFLESLGGEKDAQNHDVIRLKDARIKRVGGKFQIERGYNRHPVVGVTWYGAVAYAKWVGKRLPTEAEWEIACLGGNSGATYSTGETIEKSQANFFSSDTTAVMSYPSNQYGLYDMAGNVYEWCADWYDYSYYDVSIQEPDNPKGPLQGVYRVLRGGCWKSLKEDLRCAKRHRNNPGATDGTYGFRCAQDV